MCIAIPIEVIKKIITSLTRPLGHPLWLCLRGFIFSCGFPIAISNRLLSLFCGARERIPFCYQLFKHLQLRRLC